MEEEAARALAQPPAEEEEAAASETSSQAVEGAADADEGAADADEGGGAADEDATTIIVDIEEALEAEAASEVVANQLLPPRVKARTSKTQFFPSPVPFDRHLSALELSGLNAHVRDAVLGAKPSSHVRVVHGPPGTGKTRFLASLVNEFGNDRILACAPTNVGAANLYGRVLDNCEDASLLMPLSRVPAGTAVVSQSPHARVVCCTISGRAGHILDAEQFGVVLVDEAAQCMEAWMWCLLRPEVHTIVMVGDTHQLPALTSEEGERRGHGRSLMQRLLEAQYPVEFLATQHRMHPEIVAFPNAQFYGGRLQTAYTPKTPAPEHAPYEVVEVVGDCRQIGTSYENKAEVAACVDLQKRLAASFGQVVIISPYQAQTRALLAAGACNVHTIDSFQGNEADAVIVSVVRHEEIGFWSDYRRINVALTRARHCLRVVGAASRWGGLLRDLTVDAKKRECHVLPPA